MINMNEHAMKSQDQLNRYLFDNAQVRGEIVQLSDSYKSILENHNYPDAIQDIIGQLFAATSLLTATLKFEGDISVQLQGDGPVRYIAINGSHKQDLRGVARYDKEPESNRLSDLVGKGYLVITITPTKGERYQGIIALEHETLAECLATYFEQSEQLATRLWLFTDLEKQQAAGMLIQVLPAAADKKLEKTQAEDFEHLVALTNTVKAEELFTLPANEVLYRLYHQEEVQLFEPSDITFNCGCSREKSLNAIASVEAAELEEILKEDGKIETRCEYCLSNYLFTEQDLLALLADKSKPQ